MLAILCFHSKGFLLFLFLIFYVKSLPTFCMSSLWFLNIYVISEVQGPRNIIIIIIIINMLENRSIAIFLNFVIKVIIGLWITEAISYSKRWCKHLVGFQVCTAPSMKTKMRHAVS
jgi:hypothetical protein